MCSHGKCPWEVGLFLCLESLRRTSTIPGSVLTAGLMKKTVSAAPGVRCVRSLEFFIVRGGGDVCWKGDDMKEVPFPPNLLRWSQLHLRAVCTTDMTFRRSYCSQCFHERSARVGATFEKAALFLGLGKTWQLVINMEAGAQLCDWSAGWMGGKKKILLSTLNLGFQPSSHFFAV